MVRPGSVSCNSDIATSWSGRPIVWPVGRRRSTNSAGCRAASDLQGGAQRRDDYPGHAATESLEHVVDIHVVTPQRDPPVMHLEDPAGPELNPQRSQDERIGAFGQHHGAVCGNAVDLHLERKTAFHAAEQFCRSPSAPDSRQSDVLVDEVVVKYRIDGLEVLILERIQ